MVQLFGDGIGQSERERERGGWVGGKPLYQQQLKEFIANENENENMQQQNQHQQQQQQQNKKQQKQKMQQKQKKKQKLQLQLLWGSISQLGLQKVGVVRVLVFMYLAITVRSCSLCANGNVDNILNNVSKSSWSLSGTLWNWYWNWNWNWFKSLLNLELSLVAYAWF